MRTRLGMRAAGGDAFGPDSKNPKIINGPEGYKIDTSKCPSTWKDNEGVTDTEIKLGHSFVFSGGLAANGGISNGFKAYLEHINATEGGVKGRKFSLAVKDDGYEAARVKANTDEILETVKPLLFPVMAGTPGNLAVYDKLNEVCAPHIMAATGHPAWSDPVNHPWTTGSFLTYPIEGAIWADYVANTFGKGATVAALVTNNDFGLAYKNGFEKRAKEVGVSLVKAELVEANNPTVTNEVTTLASTNADVFIIMTAGATCSLALTALSTTSWKPKGKLIATTCTGNYLKAAATASADFVSAQYRKDTSDALTYGSDAEAQKLRTILKNAGLDENEYNNNWGVWYALPFVDMMKKASERPGGLSRTNVMLASWSQKYDHPFNLGAGANRIKWEANGLKDVAFTEGAQMAKWTIEGSGEGHWVPFGEVIEQNGSSVPCAWDGKTCK